MGFESDRLVSWRVGRECSLRSGDSLGGRELSVLLHAARSFPYISHQRRWL